MSQLRRAGELSSRTMPAECENPALFPHIWRRSAVLSHLFSVLRSASRALSNLDTVEVTESSSVGPTTLLNTCSELYLKLEFPRRSEPGATAISGRPSVTRLASAQRTTPGSFAITVR